MLRCFIFAALVSSMTIGAMLMAGGPQAGRADAADASNCKTIVVAPDAGYGFTDTREIRVCS